VLSFRINFGFSGFRIAKGSGAGSLDGIAFSHGLVLLVKAYAYGHISGTHINPAVTFGLAIAGAIDWAKAVSYWIAQFLGGIAAAAVLMSVLGGADSGLGATLPTSGVTVVQVIVIEALLTFFLVNTMLTAAVSGKAGDFAGLAIGMILTLSNLMGGPLTGASLNPARTLGPAVLTGNLATVWMYLVGTLAGAALAAFVDKYLKDLEKCQNTK